jgi:hypothetical protein
LDTFLQKFLAQAQAFFGKLHRAANVFSGNYPPQAAKDYPKQQQASMISQSLHGAG